MLHYVCDPASGRAASDLTRSDVLACEDGSHKSFARPAYRDRGSPQACHADRPLRAGHSPEYRHNSPALRLPGHRSTHHRAGRLPRDRSCVPPGRHGLPGPGHPHPAHIVFGLRGLARPRAAFACAADDQPQSDHTSITHSTPTRCCCSAARALAFRKRCTRQPTPVCASRCGRACVRSMLRWRSPW